LKKEYEAKIILHCTDLQALEERLKRLGAAPMEEAVEEDTYYQHPCRDFAETDEALRIRRSRGSAELTYKGPREHGGGGVKARVELTVRVDDAEAMDEVLRALGFTPVAAVRKKRRYYRLGDVTVSLDLVEGLGCFAEVEYSGAGGDPARAVLEALERLGVADKPRTVKSYLELLLEKLHQHS